MIASVRRRDRLVYFRISAEEFEAIRRACDIKGARSVSDLARTAVQEFIKPPKPGPEQQMASSIEALRGVVEEIKLSLQQLVSTGASDLAAASSPAGAEEETRTKVTPAGLAPDDTNSRLDVQHPKDQHE